MATKMNSGNGILVAPERNSFFYGKLMDVAQFEKEQRYFNRKRWLLNRLVLGSGVACGLNVIADLQTPGMIQIQQGVVIDGFGREIIVPEVVSVNPTQLTDDQGAPAGEPITTGTVAICLAYAETCADLVPVLVPDCDTPGNCAPSTIREGFRILVRLAEGDVPEPPTCKLGEVPLPADGALHALLCERINNAICSVEALVDPCVLLARVTLPLNGESINSCAGRSLVYSNALLYELILCLAGQVGQLAQGRILRYISGDGQTGSLNNPLDNPIVVEVVDGEGNPVNGVLVQFEVTTGGGSVNPMTANTTEDGRTETQWTLGSVQGEQSVTASAVGAALTVTFRATAV